MAAVAKLKYEFSKLINNFESLGAIYFVFPYINRSKLKLIGFYVTWFLIFLTCIQLLFTICLTGFSDLMEIIDIAPNIGATLMSAIKYMKIHTNKKMYSKIYDHICGSFWNLLPEHSEDNVKIVNKYLKTLQMTHTILNTFSILLIIVVDSIPWLVMVYEEKILEKNVPHLYPFDAWYPFDKVKWYSIAYIWESIMTAIVIGLYSLINLIHLTYIAFVCMELKLLGCWLEGLISPNDITCTKKGPQRESHTRVHVKFNMIAKRYNFLYEYVRPIILSHNF